MALQTSGRHVEVTPIYFGEAAHPLAGWWHQPVAGTGDLAVLLCSAYGREEASGHRTLLQVAHAAASAGWHAMRFDYAGCGDSAGDESMPELFAAWLKSIDLALEELRRLSGCRRIALVGLRLGSTLATLIGSRRVDVDLLVAIAPVVTGRGFVRELKALRGAGQAPGMTSPADGSLESGGFTLTGATLADLAAVDLRRLEGLPARRMLVLDRVDMPSAGAWVEHLVTRGVDAAVQPFDGYAEMMQGPHESKVPAGLVDTIVRWLFDQKMPQLETERQPLLPAVSSEAVFGAVKEQYLSLCGVGERLFGIATQPLRRRNSGLGLLLINAGAQRHTGPGRLYVQMARRWAALGAVVVRLDLSGLGESPARADAAENVVYSPSAFEEVAAAVRYLRATYAVERCHVVGLCSGAFHAMKTALRGAPIDGVLAINPLTFFWRPGMSLDTALPAHLVASEIARYRLGLFAADRWRKLLRGQVDVQRVGALLRQRALLNLSGWLRDTARALRWPIENDLALELHRYAELGIALRFVFAQDEPGEDLLRSQGGRAVDRLLRRQAIAIDRVADADHTFTGSQGRANLMALLDEWVLANSAAIIPEESESESEYKQEALGGRNAVF